MPEQLSIFEMIKHEPKVFFDRDDNACVICECLPDGFFICFGPGQERFAAKVAHQHLEFGPKSYKLNEGFILTAATGEVLY